MSDYARFVQAVATSTRDCALDDVLEENRILQESKTRLEETMKCLKETNTRLKERNQVLEVELGVNAIILQRAQERADTLEAGMNVILEKVGNVKKMLCHVQALCVCGAVMSVIGLSVLRPRNK